MATTLRNLVRGLTPLLLSLGFSLPLGFALVPLGCGSTQEAISESRKPTKFLPELAAAPEDVVAHLTACINQGAARLTSKRYAIVLNVKATHDGDVTSAGVDDSMIGDEEIEACMVSALEAMTLPASVVPKSLSTWELCVNLIGMITSIRAPYPSDLTAEQWELLKSYIPVPQPGPNPVKYERREIVNAILYVKRTGCQWRHLPHDFPKWQAVYKYFRQWTKMGIWRRINDDLRSRVRVQEGRNENPTAAIIDSQSVKTTEAGGERGYDAGKKVNGRKRHILVDVLGLLLCILILPANIQDRDGGRQILETLHATYPTVTKVWADGGYQGELVRHASEELSIDLEIVKRSDHASGFYVLPRRWVVERTFGWWNRERRLSKYYERLIETGEAFVYITMSQLMSRRLSPA